MSPKRILSITWLNKSHIFTFVFCLTPTHSTIGEELQGTAGVPVMTSPTPGKGKPWRWQGVCKGLSLCSSVGICYSQRCRLWGRQDVWAGRAAPVTHSSGQPLPNGAISTRQEKLVLRRDFWLNRNKTVVSFWEAWVGILGKPFSLEFWVPYW